MLKSWRQNPDKGIGNRRKTDSEARRVLGIFTGQGAQWPAMGRLLLLSSDYCRRLLETLDRSLAELPKAERPSWSLLSELLVEGSSSRVKLAAFSQPICTAIQILLVDLLRSAGITFSAVVGHSSGEIAAAYAAGFISAYDAIRIAYYRGLNANAARGHNGQKGAMIAVGTSLKNAQELCELSEFKGRINVAACNSFSSTTISGDADAIDEAKVVFEDEKKFVRLLQVDTAYHSYHMQYCSDSYFDSLRKCNVTVETRPTNVSWFSSVYAGQIVQPTEDLKCTYWNENMVKPVFFAQALQSALMTTESFDIAVEVGPHPALKGPASQVMQDLGKQIPYCGLLKRGENDVEAFADGLGHLWTHMADAVGLGAFDNLVRAGPKCNVIKGLPNYAWDHDRIYWHESRHSRALRLKNNPNHELLGRICPDSTEFEIRWRNFIRPVEIPWLTGHKLQGQIVFPAAAYVVLALESSKYLVKEEAVKLVEVQDFSIRQAMVFADDSTEIETLFSLVDIDRQRDMVQCSFRHYAATGGGGDEMILFAEGRLKVMINTGQSSVLPRKQPIEHNLVEVDIDRWYSFLDDVGYGFSLPFKPLESANRKLGVVTGNISLAHIDHSESTYLIHPTTLDAVMQALHLAYAYPEDGRFWSLHVPRTIERVRIDPVAYKAGALTSSHLQLAAHLEDPDSSSIYGHADLFSERNQHVLLQVEGFLSIPLSKASAADDNQVYMKVVWKATNPDGEAVALDVRPSDRECEVVSVAERVSLYYLRNLDMEISRDHPARATGPYKGMFDFSSHVISKVSTGQHPYVKKEWLDDTYEDVMKLCARYPDNLDLRMLQLVEKFPDVIRGKTTMLEHMKQDNLLDLCYENAFGIPAYSQRLSRMVALFAHRYPHMNILEIGAGTGGVTKGIMKNLQGAFNVYTFTDISTGFFPTAAEVFKNESDKMIFKALDIEQDPVHQGFQPGSFDLVIASLVLHATRNLERTMTHVRQLLKPGGYLIAFEITNAETLTTGTIFGTLPGWWLGADDGRVLSPGISSVEWDTLLRKTGFSGIDSITPDLLPLPFPWSLFCSQAVDNRIQLLRTPLSAPQESFLSSLAVQDLLVIGGKTLKTSRLVGELSNLLRRYFKRIQYVKDLSELQKVTATSATTVLSLTDIDGPVFKSLTPESFEGLKKVFEGAHPVLWITQDSKVDPFMNMIVGFGRTQLCENPTLTLQFLDVGTSEQLNSYIIAETLLRLAIMAIWAYKGTQSDILWSLEPEMALQRGNILIPRILDDPERNDRYNSSRRNISKYIDIQASSVQLKKVGNSYYLQEAGSNYMQEKEEGVYPAPLIRVSYSSLISFKLGQKKYSIVLGTVVDAAEQVIGLSEINGSVARLAENLFVPCRVPEGSEATFVLSAAIHLVASFILSHLSSGDLVIVHEPNHLLASAISKHAAQQGIKAIFSSIQSTTGESQSLFLQPFSPQMRVITSRNDVSLFIDCTLEDITRANSSTFAPFLPNCEKQALAALLQRGFPISAVSGVKEMFRQALSEAERSVSPIPCLNIISSSEISALNTTKIWSVVDWVSTTTAPVSIETADSRRLFSGNKTYWLAGLTGLLGTSLCDWMLRHGARYIAFSSRCPKIDENWLASIRSSGAVVEVFSNDITNKRDLENLHANISKTLPPIGGVTHAAMVLEDTPIREMSFDSLMKVIKPKVEGAINLHELFLDANLDFFVMFSSTAAVMGNVGQANYSAANEFLTSLTTQRKRAGLAASLINIGPIIGVGYLMRKVSQASRDDLLHYGGYKYLSERDFQQLFAEAVLAGRPGSNQDPEFITTGLRHVSPNDAYKPLWLNNPKFGHLVTQHVVATSEVNTGKSEAPAKSRLLNSKTLVEARQIIQDVFISNLENLLQMTITRPNQEQSVSAIRTDDLGIDSLIAVEIRSWFMKSLQINMPLLKILSGVSVDDIVDFALQNLPREFIPDIAEEPREVSIPSSAEAFVLDNQEASDTSQDSDPDIELDDISTSSKTGVSPVLSMPTILRQESLSYAQSMFWFVKVFASDQTTLNQTALFSVKGDLYLKGLEEAIAAVGRRHEMLRTAFFVDMQGQPVQAILDEPILHLEKRRVHHDYEISEEFTQMKNYHFRLEKGETLRVLLLSRSSTENYLLIGCHHIIIDKDSQQVFVSDIAKAFGNKPLGPEPLQYSAYANKQREDYISGQWSKQLSYWKHIFPDIPPPLPVLSVTESTNRTPLTDCNTHNVKFQLDAQLSRKIQRVCREHKVTPFHFYLSVLKVLLFRYTDASDLSIGIANADKVGNNTIVSIGPFLNLLPLRFRLDPDQSFGAALEEARKTVYSALSHSDTPFEVLLKELQVPRSAYHAPLFQAFINYRQELRGKLPFGNCQMELLQFELGKTAYDVSLDIISDPTDSYLLTIIVQEALYTKSDAQTLLNSYVELLKAFLQNPQLLIGKAPLFREADVKKAIEIGRGPTIKSTWPETVVHRVSEVIRHRPAKTAIKDGRGKIATYGDLERRINCIAATLLNAGVRQGSKVSVFQEPTSDWICSLLAIMYIGGVYIPLDRGIPSSRLVIIVKQSEPNAILIDSETATDVASISIHQSIVIDVSQLALDDGVMVSPSATLDSPAAILYTSGSTGTPKGIVLRHENLRNEVEFSSRIYGFGEEIVLQQSALCFDMSLTQIFSAIAYGGTLIMIPRSLRGDSLTLTQLIVEEKISFTGATPSEYMSWFLYGNAQRLHTSNWKIAIAGGEQVPETLLKYFQNLEKLDLRLFNAYGPTEVTCSSNKMQVSYMSEGSPNGRIPAGYTTPNCSVYILDNNLQPVPVGIPGEIVVAGAGVCAGYLNNENLTKEIFIPDIYAPTAYKTSGWTTMYRTGDRGRWREDGTIVVEGRIAGDTQVKLHGIRIDLQDIENAIIETSKGILTNAVVSVRKFDDSEADFLVAHVLFLKGFLATDKENYLKNLASSLPLPQYMWPATMIDLERFPVSVSMKLSRRVINALPLPQLPDERHGISPSLTVTEERLKEIWERVIPRDITSRYTIDSDTDFFLIGGTSLLLVTLQAQVQRDFDIALPLIQMFEASTLGSMAAQIKRTPSRVSNLDEEKESDLSLNLVAPKIPRDTAVSGSPKAVILTGATGHLGKVILQKLLNDDEIELVYCIAVRSTSAQRLPLNNKKVLVYEGDLTQPRLGLSEKDAAEIFRTADAVIHNGAEVSYLRSYYSLRGANVESTKALVQLCLPRLIPFHYISSAAVSILSGRTVFGEISAAPYPPPANGSDGYAASKWVSERYLEKAHDRFGLPVWIHRPSSITRDDNGHTFQDLIPSLFRFSRLMRAVPRFTGIQGFLNFVPVDMVAQGILQQVHSVAGTEVQYINQIGDLDISLTELREFFERDTGESFDIRTPAEWAARAKALGLNDQVAAFYHNIEERGPIIFPRLIHGAEAAG
ncbi:hypothetical protein V8E54_005392 [Elaphomyces granulatus]